MIYSITYEGVTYTPEIDKTAIILPGAKIIGDVKIGPNVSVWYNAVIRADNNSIAIGENSNIQDNCVVHTSLDADVVIGKNVSVGHNAIIHGTHIDDNVLIGMGATLLNNSHIGPNSLVGAGALVTERKEYPGESLILGSPAKRIKQISPEQKEGIISNCEGYLYLAEMNSLSPDR